MIVLLARRSHAERSQAYCVLGGNASVAMQEEEIQQVFKAPAGYLGPVGIPASKAARLRDAADSAGALPLMFADSALKGRKNLIAGANKEDYHLRNITPGKDFRVTEWPTCATSPRAKAARTAARL